MTKFIINDLVTYIPEQHRLIPTGKRGNETLLNIPASRCLQLLLLRPGKVVSQQELFKFAWQSQGQYVTTNTFYQNVSLLRKGFVNAGIKEEIIRTVPKEGLLFSGKVIILDDENTEPNTTSLEDKSQNTEPLEIKEKHPSSISKKSTPEHGLLKEIKFISLKIRKKVMLLNPMILLISVIFMVSLVRNNNETTVDLNSSFRIPDINQCSVYINKSEITLTPDGYIRFLKSKNVVCRPNQFIYITDGNNGSSKVVQRCENEGGHHLACETLYPLDINEPVKPSTSPQSPQG